MCSAIEKKFNYNNHILSKTAILADDNILCHTFKFSHGLPHFTTEEKPFGLRRDIHAMHKEHLFRLTLFRQSLCKVFCYRLPAD